MRILFTADPEIPVPPELYGGVQRLVDSLVVGMKARGHYVGLVANPASTSPADHFSPFPGTKSQNSVDSLHNTRAVWSAVKSFKPEVIHSFSRLMYMLPLLKSSLPKIMTYGRRPSTRQVFWSAKIAGDSLIFTGCSKHISQTGKAAGGRWRTIYNFVEMEKFTYKATVESDAPVVFLSRIERIKGAHTAIAAARRAGRRLLIAGNHGSTGEEGQYWEQEILPHLGRDGIEYVGPVNDRQKTELLGKAVAMIVPIEWEEPFGIVFVESLACGTPVISCPMGAALEIVRHGIDGFLVDSVEKAAAAIEKLPQINRQRCRQRAEQFFSASIIFDEYENLYRQLIEERKGKRIF